jgi:hypothetical protein
MAVYRDAPIKQKLTFVILCSCVLGLSLICMPFEIYERASFRRAMVSRLMEDADSLGLATAASLTFDDKKYAEQMLATIRSERYVIIVVLYDKDGKIFAEHRRSGLAAEFKTPEWKAEGTTFGEDSLTLHKSIAVDRATAGSIAIGARDQLQIRVGADKPEGAIALITRYSLQDAREPGASLKVLLAEDNLVNQRLAVRLLEK